MNILSVNLATSAGRKVQTTEDIMRQIESTLPQNKDSKYDEEKLSSRVLGRYALVTPHILE